MNPIVLLAFLLSLGYVAECRAEAAHDEKDRSAFALPFLFYTTDTGLGYGGAGLYGYRSTPGRTSQILFALTHTSKRQFQAAFKGEHYFPDGTHRLIAGIQYNRFPTQFFGIGNRAPENTPFTYTPEYVEAEMAFDRKLVRKLSLRVGTFFRNQALVERGADTPVLSSSAPWASGRMDGGLRGGLLWDGRDNTAAANRGALLRLEYVGSIYQDRGNGFNGLTFDLRAFHQPHPGWVSGTMLRANGVYGDYPFYFLPALGGQDLLRGYESDRFMDRNTILLQQDLRFPILWRIGGCAFVSAGRAAHAADDLLSGKVHVSYGGGFRYFIDRKNGMLIRCDFAFGKDSQGTYITFGEAF